MGLVQTPREVTHDTRDRRELCEIELTFHFRMVEDALPRVV